VLVLELRSLGVFDEAGDTSAPTHLAVASVPPPID
jgi:hypothetical protein